MRMTGARSRGIARSAKAPCANAFLSFAGQWSVEVGVWGAGVRGRT